MSDEIQEILGEAGATIGQTGRVLGMSPEGVRRAIKRGDIPATRFGPKTVRVPTSWLRSKLSVVA